MRPFLFLCGKPAPTLEASMHHKIRTLTFLVVFASCSSAFAKSNFWFASAADPTGTPLTSLTVDGVGSSFDVSVWFSSDTELSALEALAGFDTSSSDGTGATPLLGKLSLNGTPSTAMTGLGSGLSILGSAALAGGMLSSGSGDRTYGLDVPLIGTGLTNVAATTGRKLFDLGMMNAGLLPGESFTMSFHTADDSVSQFATFGVDVSGNVIVPDTSALRVTARAVPEPGSIFAFVGGAAVLLRRRARK
jgi:hypothetical protein